MDTGNTIEGRIRDPQGGAIGGSLTLLAADATPAGARRFKLEAYANNAGEFRFTHVSPGKYVLRLEPSANHPPAWDSAFYPGSSSRADARVIEFKGTNQHLTGLEIVPRPEVAYRKLTVRVRLPDGQPLSTAWVDVTSDDWDGRLFIERPSGEGITFVPTNRKIRITVTDSWQRGLKEKYVAEFEPGDVDLEKEFIVEPE